MLTDEQAAALLEGQAAVTQHLKDQDAQLAAIKVGVDGVLVKQDLTNGRLHVVEGWQAIRDDRERLATSRNSTRNALLIALAAALIGALFYYIAVHAG